MPPPNRDPYGMSFEDRGPTNPRPTMDTRPVVDDPGTGYMSQPVFESVKGITDTNPYGREGFFSRVFGIDPSKIDYTNTLGTQGIANVRNLAYDQFMNPLDSRGQVRGMLDEGSLTRFGPVTRDPNRRPDRGIASMLPIVGPMLRFADRGSELSVPGAQFPTEAGPSYVPATSARVNQRPSGSIFIERVDEPAFPEVVNPNLYDGSDLATPIDTILSIIDRQGTARSEVPITAAEVPVTAADEKLTPSAAAPSYANLSGMLLSRALPDGYAGVTEVDPRLSNDEVRFEDLINPDRDRMLALEPVGAGLYNTPNEALLPQTFLEFGGVPSIDDMIRFPTGTQL